MAKTIPCWECKGKGTLNVEDREASDIIKCPLCKGGGVISVYTQEEVDKRLKLLKDVHALKMDIAVQVARGEK